MILILVIFHGARLKLGRAERDVVVDQFVASAIIVVNLMYPTLVKRTASCFLVGTSVGGIF